MSKVLRILSEPVRSGKTTALCHYPNNNKKVFALLMPDLVQKRKLYISSLRCLLPLEVYAADYPEALLQFIGRFSFLNNSFGLAQQELNKALNGDYEELIIDEIGKLEYVKNLGYEPGLSICLESWKKNPNCHLLLVIRDYLLKEAMQHYQLDEAILIGREQLPINQTDITNSLAINALLLCGGESKRMGSPKSLLVLHEGLPQYLWLNKMVNGSVKEVIIACKASQSHWFDPNFKLLLDSPEYENAGPLNAILGYIKTHPKEAVIVLACDYLNLSKESMLQLKEACELFESSVALSAGINDALEPMLCCLHPKDFETIGKAYASGERSLKRILETLGTLKIVIENPSELKSFDTLNDLDDFNENLLNP